MRTLKANGSPAPEFETVEERVYLSTVIRMHEGFDVPQNVAQSDAQNVAQSDALSERTFTKMEESIIRRSAVPTN